MQMTQTNDSYIQFIHILIPYFNLHSAKQLFFLSFFYVTRLFIQDELKVISYKNLTEKYSTRNEQCQSEKQHTVRVEYLICALFFIIPILFEEGCPQGGVVLHLKIEYFLLNIEYFFVFTFTLLISC